MSMSGAGGSGDPDSLLLTTGLLQLQGPPVGTHTPQACPCLGTLVSQWAPALSRSVSRNSCCSHPASDHSPAPPRPTLPCSPLSPVQVQVPTTRRSLMETSLQPDYPSRWFMSCNSLSIAGCTFPLGTVPFLPHNPMCLVRTRIR